MKFGDFGSHVYNGGVHGEVKGEQVDDFWNYSMKISVSNFGAEGSFEVNLQDAKMIDDMIAALHTVRDHMLNNKVAEYI